MEDQSNEYPKIESNGRGFVVRPTSHTSLPGYYTSYILAEKALNGYLSRMKAARKPKRK